MVNPRKWKWTPARQRRTMQGGLYLAAVGLVGYFGLVQPDKFNTIWLGAVGLLLTAAGLAVGAPSEKGPDDDDNGRGGPQQRLQSRAEAKAAEVARRVLAALDDDETGDVGRDHHRGRSDRRARLVLAFRHQHAQVA